LSALAGVRLGPGAHATPLAGIGGAVSGLPMALLMAVLGVAALALFVFVARHARSTPAPRPAGGDAGGHAGRPTRPKGRAAALADRPAPCVNNVVMQNS